MMDEQSPRYLVPIPQSLQSRLASTYATAFEAGRARNWEKAFAAFLEVFETLRSEQQPNQRFHKGVPLHNMGLARLFAENIRDATYYTFLAFLEDAQSKADERLPAGAELGDPAARNLIFVFGLPGPLVAGLAERVRQLVGEDQLFQDPRDLARVLGIDTTVIARARRPRPISEIAIANRVEGRLLDAGFQVLREAAVSGLVVDLALAGKRGLLLIDALSVDPEHPGRSLEAGSERLRRIAEASPGVRVVAVVEDRWEGVLDSVEAIVTESKIASVAGAAIGEAAPVPTTVSSAGERPRIFAAMPLAAGYDDTFFVAIRGAATTLRAVAERVDHNPRTGDVVLRIKERIAAAAVVIADVSDARPSVLHEYGYAEALPRPVIAITSSGLENLPFNVSHNDTIEYAPGQTNELRRRLTRRLRQELRRTGHLPMAKPRGRRSANRT